MKNVSNHQLQVPYFETHHNALAVKLLDNIEATYRFTLRYHVIVTGM